MPSEVVASGSPVPHEDLQTAGDYVVDINGVELVAPDVASFRKLYDALCALQWMHVSHCAHPTRIHETL